MDIYIQIAEAIKEDISEIIHGALTGIEAKYRDNSHFIRWEIVERDIHDVVDYHLTSDGTEKDE